MNTTPVIVDSSALVALLSEDDTDHDKAARIATTTQEAERVVLIPFAVLVETLNILGKLLGRPFALHSANRITDDPTLHILDISGDLLPQALNQWERQGGGVSLTDCLVMTTADHFDTKEIFGFDKVFAKNGYQLPGEGETV